MDAKEYLSANDILKRRRYRRPQIKKRVISSFSYLAKCEGVAFEAHGKHISFGVPPCSLT